MVETDARARMKRLQLLPLGETDLRQIQGLGRVLSQNLGIEFEVLEAETNFSTAYNFSREQYLSTQILKLISDRIAPETWRVLGVTSVDLYIPILTFVFGEAQLQGKSAIVSTYRLRQEFYGLPPDEQAMNQRLLKEAAHELGHTLGLTHCDDTECVMSPSHSVEWIDLKSSHFCGTCAAAAADKGITIRLEPI
jgi:archaemetzincin